MRIAKWLVAAGLAVAATNVVAAFHLWKIEQIFSNADGTIQFVVMQESQGENGEHRLVNHTFSPLWMVVAANKTGADTYSGTVFRATGPPFNSVPFDPAQVGGTAVGTATFTFRDNDNATFAYAVSGVEQTKRITRQVFSSPVPVCKWGAQADLSLATNYQDLWWAAPAGSESGWGINFNHQGNTIFATWYTFGQNGKPLWLAVSANLTAPKVYSGNLFAGTGPAYNAVPFDPAKVVPVQVGTATFTFTDGANGTFAWTIDNDTSSKPITRQIFNSPGTVCQ